MAWRTGGGAGPSAHHGKALTRKPHPAAHTLDGRLYTSPHGKTILHNPMGEPYGKTHCMNDSDCPQEMRLTDSEVDAMIKHFDQEGYGQVRVGEGGASTRTVALGRAGHPLAFGLQNTRKHASKHASTRRRVHSPLHTHARSSVLCRDSHAARSHATRAAPLPNHPEAGGGRPRARVHGRARRSRTRSLRWFSTTRG